jgi:hypothetical protein
LSVTTLPLAAPRSRFSLRRLLLAIVAFTAVGLVPELVLLKHYESVWQLVPLVLLVLTLAATAVAWRRPSARSLQVFRAMMGLCLLAGVAGVILHGKGNLEWALERDASLHGWPLIWKILRGATPLLAPGAMAQLGLLGLLYTYHHPALEREPPFEPERS